MPNLEDYEAIIKLYYDLTISNCERKNFVPNKIRVADKYYQSISLFKPLDKTTINYLIKIIDKDNDDILLELNLTNEKLNYKFCLNICYRLNLIFKYFLKSQIYEDVTFYNLTNEKIRSWGDYYFNE